MPAAPELPEPPEPPEPPAAPGRGPIVLIALAIAAATSLSWARPNATAPDLGSSRWLPSALLPWAPGPAVVTAVQWAGYGLGAIGLAWAWRRAGGIRLPRWLPWALAVIALLGVPIGSADHLNYAAYGRIVLQGGNPWIESPIHWHDGTDPITSAVEPPWTTTPSVYGPFVTLAHAAAAALGGDDLRAVVRWWQVIVVLSWLVTRWSLHRLLPAAQDRVDLLWTVNPMLWPVAVLGAHVDTVATALVVLAVLVASRKRARSPGTAALLGAGALVGAAASTKFTYGAAGLALAVVLGLRQRGRRRAPAPVWSVLAALLVGFLAVVVPLHLWSGAHTYDQLLRSRQAVSLATPWRLLLEALRPVLGNGTTRSLITASAAVLAVLLLTAYLRLSRPATDDPGVRALWLTGGLTLAYTLSAPYTLPWYDILVWAAMPAVTGALVLWLTGIRLLVLASAYVPGRVSGMTPSVEEVTLGFRRGAAAWMALALWGAWLTAGVLSARLTGGGRAGSGRSSEPPR